MTISSIIITVIALSYSRFLKQILRSFQEIDAAVAAGEMPECIADVARAENVFNILSRSFATFGGVCAAFLI